jgi:molecular chaperone DnaJ
LGLNRSATASEIKKQYYSLAKKYHPDTNKDPKAKETFAEIQNAYEILSDDSKRQNYDNFGFDNAGTAGNPGFDGFGSAGFNGFNGSAGFNNDIFETLFGKGFNSAVGDDIEVQTVITFMEAVTGVEKQVSYPKVIDCDPCNGSGLNKGTVRMACRACRGTGSMSFKQGGMQFSMPCNACNGSGKTIPPGSNCKSCNGVGKVRTRESISVKIPAGMLC